MTPVTSRSADPRVALRWEWLRRTALPGGMDAAQCVEIASEATRMGEPLLAYDILAEGQRALGDAAPLRFAQLQALALARMGVPEAGAALLGPAYDTGARDAETAGILARCHKDLWERSGEEADLMRSLEGYLEAFHHRENADDPDARLYVGINAATLTALRGDWAAARTLAHQVNTACDDAIAKTPLRMGSHGSYWRLATKGEVALISGDLAEAANLYMLAVEMAPDSVASFSSTRRHARWLLHAQGHAADSFDKLFPIPGVLVYTGHRPDTPDRPVSRLPHGGEEQLLATLAEYLRREFPHGCLAFGSAAAGVDLLVLEAVERAGGKSHVVLPAPEKEFLPSSVSDRGEHWERVFRRQISRAENVYTLNPSDPGDPGAHFHFANLFIDGMAMMEAQFLDAPIKRLAVWDGSPVGEPGGAASFVDHWRRMEYPFDTIPLGDSHPNTTLQSPLPGPVLGCVIKGDVEGFSSLSDRQIARFLVRHFAILKEVWRRVADVYPEEPNSIETEGDGFLAVTMSPHAAVMFSLALRDAIACHDWSDLGIANEVRLRLALHAGPIHEYCHPFTGQIHYTGVHVIKAARIEPRTPPGAIMTSQAFAALAKTLGVTARFAYAGQMELAKDYGTFPMYLMSR